MASTNPSPGADDGAPGPSRQARPAPNRPLPNRPATSPELPFRFIPNQTPDASKDPETRRLARSHAVKQALQSKRRAQQASGNIMRQVVFPAAANPAEDAAEAAAQIKRFHQAHSTATVEDARALLAEARLSPPLCQTDPHLEPFISLANDSPRLKELLNHSVARQAAEPVFTVEDPVFQTFDSVFRAKSDDPALLNAVLFTFAFAVAGGNIDQECLTYQSKAMNFIRQRLNTPDKAASTTTLGAILLLAGVEARLGMKNQVELHMGAIRMLLKMCEANNIYLFDGIKRAIFWQDLNSSLMTGSDRIVDHTTFSELQWSRDPFSPNLFVLPPGFQRLSHLFPEDFLEVLKDVHALESMRDYPEYGCEDTIALIHIDNHQASIGSRIVGLPKLSPFLESCYLAAYLGATMFCCKVWRASPIPAHISSQMLPKLEEADRSHAWNDHLDLLVWLIFLGGSFAPHGSIRSNYLSFIAWKRQDPRFRDLYSTWEKLLAIMKDFIWSEKAFGSQVKTFWAENHLATASSL